MLPRENSKISSTSNNNIRQLLGFDNNTGKNFLYIGIDSNKARTKKHVLLVGSSYIRIMAAEAEWI